MENPQCIPRVTTGAGHHKERADEQVYRSAKVWDKRWQGVRGGSYLRKCSLYQESRRTLIKGILFGYMERLLGRRKHLGTFLNSHIPPDDDQHLLQKLSEEANNDIRTFRLRFTNGQACSPAPRKTKTRMTSKKICYEVRQIRWQGRYPS